MGGSEKEKTVKLMTPPMPELPAVPKKAEERTYTEVEKTWIKAYNAWQESLIEVYNLNKQMFKTTLNGFMKPFWLSVIMNVTVFVVGILCFSIAMVISLLTGQYTLGLIFGGIDAATFLTFFLSNPIENLEKDMEFVTWLGLIYNTYWTRSGMATNPETFQEDMKNITGDAEESLQRILATHKKVKVQQLFRRDSTSTTPKEAEK